jgi:cytochrome c biogenesis protein CcmG/thiol:disulfide interchange protein DsbE
MKRIAGIALILAIALVAAACAPSDQSVETLPGSERGNASTGDGQASGAENQIAPLFSVVTANGDTFSLGEHIVSDARPVFLNLWASWCFPCREEMPAISAAAKTFTNIQFIGVAIQDTESDARGFLDEIGGVSYLIGFDNDGTVDDAYRPLGLPASYIISADGVILEQILGQVTEESLAEKFETYFG